MENGLRADSQSQSEHIEEYIVEFNEKNSLKIQNVELDSGIPQVTTYKEFCKHTQDEQKFLVAPNKGMGLIHGTPTEFTVYIENFKHPIIVDTGLFSPQLKKNI
ncbi:hypothetical protein O181_014777 [Austropuccinia psidii MF-1]|uniref:Uncharacterized protein n=1 Tax=Austropuccinia psidii MF-1 TaxID=1389203 RepID=A0A9Q3GQ55_9BASI|nr:hypothetical protein [Austropuccinia psidii MF-1]